MEPKKSEQDEKRSEEFNILYKLLMEMASKNTSNQNTVIEPKQEVSLENILMGNDKKKNQCKACLRVFSCATTLQNHLDHMEVCRNWTSYPEEARNIQQSKPIGYFMNELLDGATSDNSNNLKCKFCKASFVNKGNLNKHFISSNVCNRLALYELKGLVNKLII